MALCRGGGRPRPHWGARPQSRGVFVSVWVRGAERQSKPRGALAGQQGEAVGPEPGSSVGSRACPPSEGHGARARPHAGRWGAGRPPPLFSPPVSWKSSRAGPGGGPCVASAFTETPPGAAAASRLLGGRARAVLAARWRPDQPRCPAGRRLLGAGARPARRALSHQPEGTHRLGAAGPAAVPGAHAWCQAEAGLRGRRSHC